MAQIPTVAIVNDAANSGYSIINEADFDPKHHKLYGEQEPAATIPLGTDSGDQFSDDQLREIIEEETGKKPHHKVGRDKLIAKFNELNAKA